METLVIKAFESIGIYTVIIFFFNEQPFYYFKFFWRPKLATNLLFQIPFQIMIMMIQILFEFCFLVFSND